jgi:hypothetical protein
MRRLVAGAVACVLTSPVLADRFEMVDISRGSGGVGSTNFRTLVIDNADHKVYDITIQYKTKTGLSMAKCSAVGFASKISSSDNLSTAFGVDNSATVGIGMFQIDHKTGDAQFCALRGNLSDPCIKLDYSSCTAP